MDLFAFDDLYVRRLKEHDPETETHFSNYCRALLYAKLCRRLPAQDIDDVIQIVFERALTRLGDLRDGRKLGAFVLGFCNKILLEHYRKDARTEPLEETHNTIPGKVNTEEDFVHAEDAAAVREVLGSMRNRREADILRAVFLDEGDRDEVCRRFQVTEKNLRVLLHRAKKDFKAAYRRKTGRDLF